MIKLKITPGKLASINAVVELTIIQLRQTKHKLKDWPLAQANAHLFVLEELSRKMRSKLVLSEDKPANKSISYSIDEIQALVLMMYKDVSNKDPYQLANIQEISDPIFQKLLS